MLGQPPTGSPNNTVFAIMNKIAKIDTPHKSAPKTDAAASGAVENAIIPSIE
jgi:hypothetical protein